MGVKGLKNLDVPKVSGINQTSENFLEDRVPVTGIQLTENLIHILRNLRLSIKTFLKKTELKLKTVDIFLYCLL